MVAGVSIVILFIAINVFKSTILYIPNDAMTSLSNSDNYRRYLLIVKRYLQII